MDFGTILYNIGFAGQIKGLQNKLSYLSAYTKEELLKRNSGTVYTTNWEGVNVSYLNSLGILRNEIVQRQIYDVKLDTKKPFMVDVGFNYGYFTLYMKHLFPNAIIHAFEPNPTSYAFGKKNVEMNSFSNVTVHNDGVLDKKTKMTFYVAGGGAGDSIFKQEGYSPITCTFINFDAFLKGKPTPDVIKIDAEGSEYRILKNTKLVYRAKNLLIEFHDNLKNKTDKTDYIKLVESKGYRIEKKVHMSDVIYVVHFVKK